MSARNTVVLKGNIEERYDEGVAAGTIKPGMLIQANSAGAYVAHSTAGGYAEANVAVEDDFRGMTVAGDLPSDGVVAGGTGVGYVSGDKVRFHRSQKGDKLQMILVNGQSVDPSMFGTSNGDGKLKVASSTDQRLFKFDETIAASGSDVFVAVLVV